MAYNPQNPNGQTGSVNSAPVVIAADQSQFTTPLNIAVQESATGGANVYHLVTGATVSPFNIKSSPGKITGWYIYNSNAAARKVAFHNTAGAPTAGTNVFFSVVIPGLAGANCPYPAGIGFTAGIAITTVTGLADTDSTAVAANDLILNIFYK